MKILPQRFELQVGLAILFCLFGYDYWFLIVGLKCYNPISWGWRKFACMHAQTWNFLVLDIYIFGTFWQNFMVLCSSGNFFHFKLVVFYLIHKWDILAKFYLRDSCIQLLWPFWDGILVKNLYFLVKTLKNGICSKIKSLASFLLIFSHNTYNANTTIE